MKKDKVLHIIAGAVLSSFGFLHSPLFMLGFVGGMVKELYDYYSPNHTYDIMDIFATWVGAAVPVLIYFIIN